MGTAPIPRAYSYLRFSTKEQQHGDSFRRQSEMAAKWLDREGGGLELDTSHQDLGVSAFRGGNAKTGALSVFREAIKQGKIARGSVLVVENLDRISRDEAFEAVAVVSEIIKAGVEVVTLMDNKRWTRQSLRELNDQLSLVLTFNRGHEESRTKSIRLTENWNQKRKKAAEGHVVRRTCPPWLKIVGAKPDGRQDWAAIKFVPDPERVKMLKQIFKWRAEGWGCGRIAKELNRLEYPVWYRTKSWMKTRLSKLVCSRTMLGEWQPHRFQLGKRGLRRPLGEPVKDYYPRIITEETWQAAQSSQGWGCTPWRGTGRSSKNFLTGLMVDQNSLKMYATEQHGHRYVQSFTNAEGKTERYRWNATHLEDAILAVLGGVDWQRVFTNESQEPARLKLEEELTHLAVEEAKTKGFQAQIVDAMLSSGKGLTEALQKKAEKLEEEQASIAKRRAVALAGLDAMRRTNIAVSTTAKLPKAVPKTEDERQRLHYELKNRLKRIQLWPDGRTPNCETDRHWQQYFEDAMTDLPKRARVARAKGRAMGAIRFVFANEKAMTAYVTYMPGAVTYKKPRILGIKSQ